MTIDDLIIDDEFKNKIPPLTGAEFEQLEENIVADGEVYEPIAVWNKTIVDGHNRYQIIKKHPEIPYKIRQMEFPDKWAAFDWMYKNQLGRRNLTEQQRKYMIGKMYEARKNTVSNVYGRNQYSKEDGFQNGTQPKGRIRDQIGKELGIGNGTVIRAYDFAKGVDAVKDVSSKAADKILNGETGLSRAEVQSIKELPKKEIRKVAKDIVEGKTPNIKKDNHKEAHERDRHIANAINSITNTNYSEYTIDNLVEDVKVNCISFANTIITLVETRKDVIKGIAEKQKIADCINENIVRKLQGYMKGERH